MKLEVLYFDGCPSHEALMARLHVLMAQAGVDAPVELKRVESDEAAERERFLGSPTLRVDGQDVDPSAGKRTDFGLKCRLYPSADGVRGMVPDEFVVAALTRAVPVGDADYADGLDAFARALQSTFPALMMPLSHARAPAPPQQRPAGNHNGAGPSSEPRGRRGRQAPGQLAQRRAGRDGSHRGVLRAHPSPDGT